MSWLRNFSKTFRLRHRMYLTITFDKFSMPPDWRRMAVEMLHGQRPADAHFLARAYFYAEVNHTHQQAEYRKTIRLLERKLAAQRVELRRRQPHQESTAPIERNTP